MEERAYARVSDMIEAGRFQAASLKREDGSSFLLRGRHAAPCLFDCPWSQG